MGIYMNQSISNKKHRFGFILLFSILFSLQACTSEDASSAAELVNTYWKLTELEGAPIVTADGQREMKLTLREENKVTGFGGCNSFFGSYEYDAKKLSFSQLAATRMFCEDAMDKESQFMKSLMVVKSYKITGQTMQLFDAEEKLLARFEAVYLK